MTTGQLISATRPRVQRRIAPEALAGAGGLLFLILVSFQNILRAITSPANNASPDQILRFAHDQAWSVDLLVVTYVIGFPALFLFTTGLVRRITRAHPEAEIWAQLGLASVIAIAVFFAFVNVLDATLVAARTDLVKDPALTSTIWSLHNAVFTINLLAVAGALLGLGWGAALAGIISRRFGYACVAGAGLLAAAAAPMVPEIHGSPVLGVGLIGYLCWLLFLAVVGFRLLRIGRATDEVSRR